MDENENVDENENENDPGPPEPDWRELDELLDLELGNSSDLDTDADDVDEPRPPPSTLNTVLLTLFVTASVLSAGVVTYFALNLDDSDVQTQEPASTDATETDSSTPPSTAATTTVVPTTTTTTSTTLPVLADALVRDVSGTGVFDSFARVDNDEVGRSASGDVWFEVSGDWAIEDRSVVLTAPDPAGPSFMLSNMESSNGTIQVTMSTVDRAAGMVFRYTDPSNYLAVTGAPGASTWTVIRVEEGIASAIGSLGLIDAVDTTTVAVRLDGDFMVFSVNGVRAETFLDPDPTPGTLVGLIFGGTEATDARWTNFVAIAEDDVPS